MAIKLSDASVPVITSLASTYKLHIVRPATATIALPNFFAGIVDPVNITSASATALAVGRQGTTAPAFLVDASAADSATGVKITSAAAAGGIAITAISSGTNESMTLDAKGTGVIAFQTVASGNVGIKVAAPASDLHIAGSTLVSLQLTTAGTGATATDGLKISIIGTSAFINNQESGSLAFLTANTTRISIGATGDTTLTATGSSAFSVGRQGATDPAFVVDASAGSSATGVCITAAAEAGGVAISAKSSGTNELLTIDAKGSGTLLLQTFGTGNVGIGTTGPGAKLDINSSGAGACIRLTWDDANGSAAKYCDVLTDANGNFQVNPIGLTTFLGVVNNGVSYNVALVGYSSTQNAALNAFKFYNTPGATYEIARIECGLGSTYVNDGYLAFYTSNAGGLAERMRLNQVGNLGLWTTAFGDSGIGVLAIGTAAAPTTSPADSFQVYSSDQAAGNACLHTRTENGAVVKLYQQAHIADAAGGTEISTINAILAVLENNGLLASA